MLIRERRIQGPLWSLYPTLPAPSPRSRLRRRLPLPKVAHLDFRVLPEYILEDIIDYLFFVVRYAIVLLTTNNSSILLDMGHPASS
jgi:hypothetical protein